MMDAADWLSFAYLAVFVFGALIGSFLNVCIFRMPEDQSVVFPPSHCPKCKKPIRWYDNIPIVSFFVLKGHCRDCGVLIDPQYVMIETLAGGMAVIYALIFGFTAQAAIYLGLSYAFLVASVIDLRYRIIPDEISCVGIIAGLILSCVFPSIHGQPHWIGGLTQSFVGMVVGGGFLWVTAILVEKVVKKEAMGGGDVKLLGMIGAMLGWQGALWTIFFSSLFGSLVGIYYRIKRGEETMAFGPHICLAAVLYMFIGPQAVNWYLGALGFNP